MMGHNRVIDSANQEIGGTQPTSVSSSSGCGKKRLARGETPVVMCALGNQVSGETDVYVF